MLVEFPLTAFRAVEKEARALLASSDWVPKGDWFLRVVHRASVNVDRQRAWDSRCDAATGCRR